MQMEESGMVKLFGVFIPKPNNQPPNPTPEQLPVEFHGALRSIGAAGDPKLFFSRELHPSDVKKGLTRLAIPRSRIRGAFLTPEEDEFLKQQSGGGGRRRRLNRLSVRVIDPAGRVRRLSLSRWNYKAAAKGGGGWSYALNGGWMDVVRENGLVDGTLVQLWWFRVNDGSLGIVICKKPTAAGGGDWETKGASDGGSSRLKWGRKRART